MIAVKSVSIAAFLAAEGQGSLQAPYGIVIRCIVALAAIVAMGQAFHQKHYGVAALFAVAATFYKPVAPVFALAGERQRRLLMASPIPFFRSLALTNRRMTSNV
jgi:hypothetical protein